MDNPTPKPPLLVWQQDSGFTQHFHLYDGEAQIAGLKLEGGGSLGRYEAGDTHLTFKHEGFFGRHYRIYDDQTNAEIARFEANWTGGHGVLQFADGEQIAWKKTSFWLPHYAFERQDGSDLLCFKSKGMVKMRAEIEVLQPLPPDRLTLLTAFGMYLMVLASNAAVTTAAVVAVTA